MRIRVKHGKIIDFDNKCLKSSWSLHSHRKIIIRNIYVQEGMQTNEIIKKKHFPNLYLEVMWQIFQCRIIFKMFFEYTINATDPLLHRRYSSL